MNHFWNHWQNCIFWFKLQYFFQTLVEFAFVCFFLKSVFRLWIAGKQHNFLRNILSADISCMIFFLYTCPFLYIIFSIPFDLSLSLCLYQKWFKGNGLLLTILHDERLEVKAKIYGWIQRLDLTSSSSLSSLPSVIFTGLDFARAICDVYLLIDRQWVRHVQTVILHLFEMFPSSFSVKLYLHTAQTSSISSQRFITLWKAFTILLSISLQNNFTRYAHQI